MCGSVPHAYGCLQELCTGGSVELFMKGGNLSTLDGKPHMERILTLLQHVAHGMVYLHNEKGIMHGDLSLANVLIQVWLTSPCVEVLRGGAACPYSLGLEVSRLCGMSEGLDPEPLTPAPNRAVSYGCLAAWQLMHCVQPS